MYACESCHHLFHAPHTTPPRYGCDDRLVNDPQWASIRALAVVQAENEPVLSQWIRQAVLDRDSLVDSVAQIVSAKLADSTIDAEQLYGVFRQVIDSTPLIDSQLRADLLAIASNDPATENSLFPLLNFKGFHAIQAYRIAHALWKQDRIALAMRIQGLSSQQLGIDIHPAAKIGAGVFIDHGSGVVIGETAVVEDEVTILHGVTLGGTGKHAGDRHPKVGRGVLIGASAQLLGNISVGPYAKIGAGSVVLADVAPHTTVVGIPARPVETKTKRVESKARTIVMNQDLLSRA